MAQNDVDQSDWRIFQTPISQEILKAMKLIFFFRAIRYRLREKIDLVFWLDSAQEYPDIPNSDLNQLDIKLLKLRY